MTTQISDSSGRYFITPAQILERFLIMGNSGPTYKANDKFADFDEDTRNMVKTVFECFSVEAMITLTSVIAQGKAPRKPPVLLALAAALSLEATRATAEVLIPAIVHTATDQFVLTKMILDLGRGKGRSFKRHANSLYTMLDGEIGRNRLALQMVKYRNRAGWTHRDLLRVSHYTPSKLNNDLFAWVTGKGPATHPILAAYEEATKVTNVADAVRLLQSNPNLPWEALPTEVLANKEVWEALLPNLGSTALVRNLARMSSYGISLESQLDNIRVAASRNHPVSALSAWRTYGQGRGDKGSLAWNPDPRVVAALEAGFYQSFGDLKRSESKVFFGLDISSSMAGNAATIPGLNCREVAAVMAMVAMKQQPYMVFGFSNRLIELAIQDHWTLSQVTTYINGLQFGATDCSLPMRFCTENIVSDVDLFAIYTDNETNQAGNKPSDHLAKYRANFNPNACMATVAIQGGAFSIADPNDPGQMDFIGFDSTAPSVMLSLAEQTLV